MRMTFVLSLAATLALVALATPNDARAACTVPNTLTNGTTADATQVMANFNALTACIVAGPVGSTNSIQYNAGGGAFGALGPLTNGQLVIGSTGATPVAAQLTAGTGIGITNTAGKVTISNTGAPGTATTYWAGTMVAKTYDPGIPFVALDSCSTTIPASTIQHTYMVTGQFVFLGAGTHGQWGRITLDGVQQGTGDSTWTQGAGQNDVAASIGPIQVIVPGDNASHVIAIYVADAGATGNLTFYQRWVFAQLVK